MNLRPSQIQGLMQNRAIRSSNRLIMIIFGLGLASCHEEPQRITIHLTPISQASEATQVQATSPNRAKTEESLSSPSNSTNLTNTSASLQESSDAEAPLAAIPSLQDSNKKASLTISSQQKSTIKAPLEPDRKQIPDASQVAIPAVPAELGRPAVPPEIQEEASSSTPHALLQLQLRGTPKARSEWGNRRAVIEDQLTGDKRAYAIGDLLPRGAILVGIQPRRARIITRKSIVLELSPGQKPKIINTLSLAKNSTKNQIRQSTISYALRATVFTAVDELAHYNRPTVVQAILKLIEEGEVIAPTLAVRSHDLTPVQIKVVRIGKKKIRSSTIGERVIAILEHITKQSFGDPTQPGTHAAVAAAWQDWAGL